MKKLLILTILTVFLSTTNLFADCPPECTTCVSGTIINQTWTIEGSPYCVEGDILVESLTIEPDVRIEFLGDYVFEVAGVLIAVGTDAFPILFTKADGATRWQGILFDHAAEGSQLKYCQIEYSNNSGIRITDSIPIIEYCSIKDNHSDNGGGGMEITLNTSSAGLVLKNCDISSNTSSTHGGGLYLTLAAASLTLRDCKISNNRTNINSSNINCYGGGIYVADAAEGLSLICSEISDNCTSSHCRSRSCSASAHGGGIYLTQGNMLVENCIISSNNCNSSAYGDRTEYAYSYGAGMYLRRGAASLTNSIVKNNSTTASADYTHELGAGVFVYEATLACENSTVAYNTKEGIYNQDGIMQAVNSILYFNSGEEVIGTATVTYSDVEGGHDGEGNIDCDPWFESILDLRIRADSCCVDAGNPASRYNDECFPPSHGTVLNDIGAHGGPGACRCTGTELCEGDFDGDGDVDGADLAIFAADFGRTDCPGVGSSAVGFSGLGR